MTGDPNLPALQLGFANARTLQDKLGIPAVFFGLLQFGVLLGGAIVVESLFALPGLGRLVVTAVNQRNYLVVQGGVLVIATLFIFVNLLTDVLYTWLNPRLEGSNQG